MAKRNTQKAKTQTSNLVRKLGNAPSKPVASDQMKSTASGFQMKFNKINVSNFVTGGSSSTSTGANYGNQSTIHSIAGKKVGTATQIPQLAAPETIETKHDDSLIISLAKMFSFMQQTRDDDVKRRETEKSFAEEKKTEEQKRHEQFLKVLKDYTSIGTTTAAPTAAADSGGGIMDFIKSMIDSVMGSIQGIIDKALDVFSWLRPLSSVLMNVAKFFLMNPIGIGLLLGASLLTLLALDKNPEATTAGILGAGNEAAVSGAIMQQQAENIPPEEIQKKNAVKKALLKDAPFLTRVYDVDAEEELMKKGLSKQDAANLSNNKVPLKVPEQLKVADPELYKELTIYKLPEGIKPSTAGAGRGGMGGATALEIKAESVGGGRGVVNPEMATESTPSVTTTVPPIETPTATPVPPTPSTSSVNDVIAKNADLVMNESTSSGSGTTQPIIATSSKSTSSPDKAMSSSATQRDDTAIINRVFDRIRGGV